MSLLTCDMEPLRMYMRKAVLLRIKQEPEIQLSSLQNLAHVKAVLRAQSFWVERVGTCFQFLCQNLTIRNPSIWMAAFGPISVCLQLDWPSQYRGRHLLFNIKFPLLFLLPLSPSLLSLSLRKRPGFTEIWIDCTKPTKSTWGNIRIFIYLPQHLPVLECVFKG